MNGKIEIFVKELNGQNYLVDRIVDSWYSNNDTQIVSLYKKIKCKFRDCCDLCLGIDGEDCCLILSDGSTPFKDLMPLTLKNNIKIQWFKVYGKNSAFSSMFSDRIFSQDVVFRMLAFWKMKLGGVKIYGQIPKSIPVCND